LDRVPDLPVPARHAYLSEIAALIDDRTKRLGQHTATYGVALARDELLPLP